MENEEAVPDHLRCRRSDGRRWRCDRRVMENRSFCELHFLQSRCRQSKQVVPRCIKLRRKFRVPRSRDVASTPERIKVKKGDLRMELISMVLQRQIEKRKCRHGWEKKRKNDRVVMRDLPNGVMAISRCPVPTSGNAFTPCEKKLGLEEHVFLRRCIRSKNVEPAPLCGYKVVPRRRDAECLRSSEKNCHQCGNIGVVNLVMCSTCQKEFYCTDCIPKWYPEMSEENVKRACPVCCGHCNCKNCAYRELKNTGDAGCKERVHGPHKLDKILDAHYLICLLLPVLKKINQEQKIEMALEAKIQGKTPSSNQLLEAQCDYDEKLYCDNCKATIIDFHRSCGKCSFDLCLSCCQEIRRGSLPGSVGEVTANFCKQEKLHVQCGLLFSGSSDESTSTSSSIKTTLEWKANAGKGPLFCPPKELGGCGVGLLELRRVFPLNWIQELEVTAEEIAYSYDFPEILDVRSCCSICVAGSEKDGVNDESLRKAADRRDSSDNYLFCTTLEDIQKEGIEHFQKHWIRGQPVIVCNVIANTSDVSWDPLVMFQSIIGSQRILFKDDTKMVKATDCLDWCEVEIDIQQFLKGYLEGRTHGNVWPEMLTVTDWPPSTVFQEFLSSHYAEILRVLPFQEYTNPESGLFNLAINLPQGSSKPDLGPRVCISYGTSEELGRGDSVTKLHFEICDVVNVLTHATEVVIAEEHLIKIEKLKERHKAQDGKEFIHRPFRDNMAMDEPEEELHLTDGTMGKQELLKAELRADTCEVDVKWGEILKTEECKIDVRPLCRQKSNCVRAVGERTGGKAEQESCLGFSRKMLSKPCGVQWDVFRREDVSKLEEYLSKHFNEFRHTYCSPVDHATHPVHDQSFFLDAAHKRRLKEEFQVEPWTFYQKLGEAVMVPAGCPYQLRNLKSCTKVGMDFVSPESVKECVQLIDELRHLPNNHKAKEDKIEVKKMILYGINGAIQQIQQLTSNGMGASL